MRGSGSDGVDIFHLQPLEREVVRQRLGLRMREHAPHLLLQHRGFMQLLLGGQADQLFVGAAAPQEEGQPGRQLHVGNRKSLAGLRAFRQRFRAIQELGGAQHRHDAFLDTDLKAALLKT